MYRPQAFLYRRDHARSHARDQIISARTWLASRRSSAAGAKCLHGR